MTIATASDKRVQLERDGYCLFENVLDAELLKRTRQVSDRLLDALPAEHLKQQKSTGSMISVCDDPFFAELVSAPGALTALASLGYDNPKWSSGFVIAKPPHSPALFWHQDWWGWNDPCSHTSVPQQLFLMYYLLDTTPDNGCLRVLPGSHRKRHPMHDAVPVAHTDDLRRVVDPDHLAYQSVPEQVEMPVRAGDLVLGDARLLHSAYANKSDHWRSVITLWYAPCFDQLPDRIRATMVSLTSKGHWSEQVWDKIAALVPVYNGPAEPIELSRVPDARLH